MSLLIGCGTDKGDVFAILYDFSTSKFNDIFIDRETHMKPVTSLVCDENELISADSNGCLQTYSFTRGKKLKTLENVHESSITSLSLTTDKNYLLTTDDSGLIVFWKKSCGTWENIKTIDKHRKSAILAIHPSDKLALSLSKDNTFRVWDLYNGVQSHKIQINKPFSGVKISPSGKYYLLRTFNMVQIYDLVEACLKYSIQSSGNIKELGFISDDILCIGELKKITFYKLAETVEEISAINIHDCQCKNLSFVIKDNKKYLICSMAHSAKVSIRVYDVTSIGEADQTAQFLNSYDVSNLRISAITSVFK